MPLDSGLKHNVISDKAHLQLTVRYSNLDTKAKLLAGITRIAQNMGHVAGLPDDKLPTIMISKEEDTLTQINDAVLTVRLQSMWRAKYGPTVAVHHPCFFKIDADGLVPFAVETTVTALTELLQ